MAKLILSDGTTFEGQSFGAAVDSDGEVVFNTGMVGYEQSLTDPSYRGQILNFTYPLIGNYGVPSSEHNAWGFSDNYESEAVHVRGVVVSQMSETDSHYRSVSTIHKWLEHHGIPGITGIDTRALTQKLREHGVMLGRIVQENGGKSGPHVKDPNETNLVDEVSCKELIIYEPEGADKDTPSIAAYDCGIKNNIIRSLLKRGVRVYRLPWDFDLDASDLKYDALFISNGPGDPKQLMPTVEQIKKAMEKNVLTFGICMGNLLVGLAIGGDTYKLKYGHRSANQPCIEHDEAGNPTKKCIITSQNHGYAVKTDSLPSEWKPWFTNANDGTNEGVRHKSGRFFTVQFHPEATPGPEDANYLFDVFIDKIKQ